MKVIISILIITLLSLSTKAQGSIYSTGSRSMTANLATQEVSSEENKDTLYFSVSENKKND